MNESSLVLRGRMFVGRMVSAAGVSALMFAQTACAQEATAEMPAELNSALGWKPMPGRNYRPYQDGSVFVVASEPAQWPAAREKAAAWAAASPAFAENPAEYVFRKLTWIEAAALGAADAHVAAELRAARKELVSRAGELRAMKAANGNDWQMRNAGEQMQQLAQRLGQWLADSPADRVEAFREELAAHKPAERAVVAARYGGEERLAELIKLGKEYRRLMAAYQSVEEDTTLSEAERKLALRKAGGALGYFYGLNSNERDYQQAIQDPDLASEFGGESPVDHRSIRLPDLVALAGEEAAAGLLVEAYALPVRIELDSAGRTVELAKRLLVEGELKPARIPWALANWRSDLVDTESAREVAAVYDALKQAFPQELSGQGGAGSDWERSRALAVMAYALAIAGRGEEAAALLALTGPEATGLPYHAQVTPDAAAAVWDMVVRGADGTKGWSQLNALAAHADRGAELTAYAAKQVAESAPDSEAGRLWRARHGWALVGEEKIDEGVAVLEAVLETRPTNGENGWAQEWSQSAGRLLLLAKAAERPGLAKAWGEKLTADLQDPKGPAWRDGGLFDPFAKQQMDAGNFALIEKLLRARLGAGDKPGKRTMPGMGWNNDDYKKRIDLDKMTGRLADVIGRQGRHAEVVTLLAESPHWRSSDLAQALGDDDGGAWRPLALVAAESLHAEGRADESIAVLEALLIERSGYDPAYELYTRIRGQEARPFLEKLLAADRFEERPLIWLASLQLAAGDTAAAEATIQRAITTDPSDGEQPKGDRMRAYAVLREVALKKGDAAQAQFLAGVLAAIRRSEDADDIEEAGLQARAIREYQRALESFADAYCIQSRLARTLAEQNRPAEAAEHYKRAFELMPDSFGRVESHCFGCERAFAGKSAQSIAEEVFTEMAAKPSAKPQVYYLLGYLRMEQERWEEAAGHFTRAVEADGDYLNAWKKLAEVLPNTRRPRAEQDRVAFKLIALDPSGKRRASGVSEVRDLPALWRAYAAAGEVALMVPEQVFPLGNKAKKGNVNENDAMSYRHDRKRARTTSARLAEHDVLRTIVKALDQTYSWRAATE
jgi:tetratricopeptide (TPR) repeat protein